MGDGYILLYAEMQSVDPDMRIIIIGNKKDVLDRNPNSNTAVKPNDIKKFI